MTWNLTISSMKYLGARDEGTKFFNGNMLDFRLYEGNIGSSEMASIFSAGPVVYSLSASVYTHLLDLEWQGNETTTRITKTVDADTSDVPIETGETSTRIHGLSPGDVLSFQLLIDDTEVDTLVVTTPSVSESTVSDLLEVLQNDITILSSGAVYEISEFLPSSLVEGDRLSSRITNSLVTTIRDDIVSPGDNSLNVDSGAYLLATSPSDFVTPDATTTTVTTTSSPDTIEVQGNTYSVGESLIIGNRKVYVYQLT